MRFVDLVIDLTAILRVSRSVASKHVALRGRQLDVYRKRPGVSAVHRSQADQTRSDTAQSFEVRPDPGTIAHKEGLLPEERLAKGVKIDQRTRESHLAGDEAAPITAAEEKIDEEDVPPGIDVNVFHTKRGSKILESLQLDKKKQGERGIGDGGGDGGRRVTIERPPLQAKEHPLRHWPRPAPVETEGESRPDSPPQEKKPSISQEEPWQPTTSTPAKAEAEPESDSIPLIVKAVEEAQASGSPIHQLRESKVPATRFSRLVNYGGLAAGMLGGALTESLSRALGGGGQGSVLLSEKNTERLVAKLSQMRGAALKLGQMMSFQDSKMLPAPIQEVLQRVQDRADYMPAWQRDRVLAANLGAEWREVFSEFEEKPMAAASIGQVHKAVLRSNGRRVAVKVQFPGVADSINSDLDNLGVLLTATKLLPKGLYLDKTIDNARLELGWECDYERELSCARRYKSLLRDEGEEDVFAVPDVYPEASGKQVLTMDFLDGTGVTRVKSFSQAQRDWIGTQLLRLCLRELTEFRFMQTDPNWTNFLYNAATNKLELLDFGASREFPEAFISQYTQLLEAASRSDRDGVARYSRDLGYLTGHESKKMVEAHLQSILTLAEPFLETAPEVYDFKDQTITERVKSYIPVMLHERLTPPPEETYSLHRKLSGAFLLCARLESRVPCRKLFTDSMTKSGFAMKPM